METPSGRAFRSLLASLIFAGSPSLEAQDPPPPVLGKTPDNSATGSAFSWDFSGTDLTIKAQRQELWILDPYSQSAPFINAFNFLDLSAAPRRISIKLPPELAGGIVLGLAEIPRGELAGKNLVLVDQAFAYPNEPNLFFGVLEDDGTPLAGGSFLPPFGVDPGARLGAIDINPQRDEIAVYDLTTHSFYLLDFNFTATAGPVALLGFPSFFASPWIHGGLLEGNGGGIAYGGPDTILAPAGLLNSFESHLLVEYDLLAGGAPSGRAIDLSGAAVPGSGPSLDFAAIDTGLLGADPVAVALNTGDDSLYLFRLLPAAGPPPVRSMECSLRDTGRYQVSWSLDDPGQVDSVLVIENGVQVASVDPRAGSYLSPLPLLGNGFIELATEKAGVVGPIRPLCQLQDSPVPPFPGVDSDSVRIERLGDLTDVAVTKLPAKRDDFRGYLLGFASNSLGVFDQRLDFVETLRLSPGVATQGGNVAASGVAILRLEGQDHLALLDPDGLAGGGPPGASIHYLEGARRGQLRQRVAAIDLSQLTPQPSLLGWDSDLDGGFVAGGRLPAGGEPVLVKIRFDGQRMWASQMAPLPHRLLSPFADLPLVGIGVSVLPSGNLLVAGSDVFARTYTEALLLTPFTDDPARSALLVGYAQGLPIPKYLRSDYGLGVGPARISGLATAYFPPEPGEVEGVGVSYLPASGLPIIENRNGSPLSFPLNLLVHARNRSAHPGLKAEQLDQETLEAPRGGSAASRRASPSFVEAAPIDYFYYLINESTGESAQLAVEAVLGGSPVPEAGGSVLIPPGRYFRRSLPGRSERDIEVRLTNRGAGTARLTVITGAMAVPLTPAAASFKRGDCDADGTVALTDAVFGLSYQFLAGPRPPCPDSCDSDDSGLIDVSDMVLILNFLFNAGAPPSPPGPSVCGADPTPDDALDPCGVVEACR
jgi:hypothetical protein